MFCLEIETDYAIETFMFCFLFFVFIIEKLRKKLRSSARFYKKNNDHQLGSIKNYDHQLGSIKKTMIIS